MALFFFQYKMEQYNLCNKLKRYMSYIFETWYDGANLSYFKVWLLILKYLRSTTNRFQRYRYKIIRVCGKDSILF